MISVLNALQAYSVSIKSARIASKRIDSFQMNTFRFISLFSHRENKFINMKSNLYRRSKTEKRKITNVSLLQTTVFQLKIKFFIPQN